MPSAIVRRRDGFEHEVEIREHRLTVDEPPDKGGTDRGPKPTELLAASLASCTSITILMYAERKGWELGAIEVAVDYEVPSAGSSPSLRSTITTPAELTDEQRERILAIAAKCPVHKTLAAQDVSIEDDLRTIGS
jgi:putative redox protein